MSVGNLALVSMVDLVFAVRAPRVRGRMLLAQTLLG
jgi:hypothetical protein